MMTVLLRVRALLPTVLMGESGCGKTSLITYLSQLVTGTRPKVLKVNGGTTAQEIREFVDDNWDSTEWLFLDEINTCQHLALINVRTCTGGVESCLIVW